MSEYHQTLIAGSLMDGYEASYNDMISKMEAAGLSDLLKKVNEMTKAYMKK